MGKGEEKMEELNVRKCKEEYRKNNKKEYTNNCALFLAGQLQKKSQLQLFLYLLFDYNPTGNIESESVCVCDAGKILWQLVNIIFTGRPPELAIPLCYCLVPKRVGTRDHLSIPSSLSRKKLPACPMVN
jgi:hypothetical protein